MTISVSSHNADAGNMERWCRAVGQTEPVKGWLRQNPPPQGWQGTPEMWAYCEMPCLADVIREGSY